MPAPAKFIEAIKDTFPDDRLTYQKRIATFHPENAAEAAELFRLASRHKCQLYITGFGNNIDPIGEPFDSLVSIRTDRLNTIHDVDAQNYYVKVGGGYPLRQLNQRLERDNLWLPHAALPYVGSVGGALAVGLDARLHGQPVPLKRYLLQAEIVTGEGEIITPGSVCFKSVSGFDVVKIFWCSWGVLGLIVTATLRIMPLTGADDYRSMTMEGVDRTALVDALQESNTDSNAVYSRKIRAKFDPHHVLPLV